MAIEGKRIHELTDEQSTYNPDLYAQVDDSTLTNTRKIKVGKIYPLTNTLSDSGTINPGTTLLRLNDGSGGESKRTVTNVLNDSGYLSNSSSLSFTGVADSNFSSINLFGKKLGAISVITGSFVAVDSNNGDPKFLKQISGYTSPGFNVYFPLQTQDTSIVEGGYGYIDTSGNVYIVAGKGSSNTWYFNATIIS